MKSRLKEILVHFFHTTDNKRFAHLAVAILLMIMLHPLVESGGTEGLVADFLFLIVFLMGISAAQTGKRHFVIAIVLGSLATIGRIQGRTGVNLGDTLLFESVAILFFAHVTWFVGWHIWSRRQQVDHEVLYAAICLYLVIGFLWSHIYLLMQMIDPASFHSDSASKLSRADFIYFSYTTLTTVGYGDILPSSRFARSFSIVEALSGQLYIAILISRLVSATKMPKDPTSTR